MTAAVHGGPHLGALQIAPELKTAEAEVSLQRFRKHGRALSPEISTTQLASRFFSQAMLRRRRLWLLSDRRRSWHGARVA